jgi:hypothetical protein
MHITKLDNNKMGEKMSQIISPNNILFETSNVNFTCPLEMCVTKRIG